METLVRCPLCLSEKMDSILKVKDQTSSLEDFNIFQCQDCSFRFTNPRPSENQISNYYQSEKYISHTGGSKNLMDTVYRTARRFMIRKKMALIENLKTSGKLLDYGCGTGEFLDYAKKKQWEVSGVEPSAYARQKASTLLGLPVQETLSKNKIEFDVITLWHVLEHIYSLRETLSNIKEQIKDTGLIFIAVPNYESHDANYYHEHWAAYDVPRHIWHFSKKTMTDLITQEGLKIVGIKPMNLDSYYISLLSEEYKAPKKNKIIKTMSAIWIGLKSNLLARQNTNHSSLIYIVAK